MKAAAFTVAILIMFVAVLWGSLATVFVLSPDATVRAARFAVAGWSLAILFGFFALALKPDVEAGK